MWISKNIRASFVNFFVKSGHIHLPSSSLVPFGDPTLLFTNAGMNQFKDVFLGHKKPPATRAVTSQKCVRAGGKHNDLEQVGYTARHHTFFEMLGNFSFGDYFKEEAIYYTWQFLHHELCIPKNKLVVTFYKEDHETFNLWKKIADLSNERIIPISTTDNFWSMGDTGPCGPCSEIFYDHGEHLAGELPSDNDNTKDRFVEIWNLVFMQYCKKETGKLTTLPSPSVDTGMGLERITAVLQNTHDNFKTDLFLPLIKTSIEYTKNPEPLVSYKVIADHIRSSSFLIADGVIPSNEGRGYVLRRIIRRAVRHVKKLSKNDNPLLYRLIPCLISIMGDAYPELKRAKVLIENILKSEEERFSALLERGLHLLDKALNQLHNTKIFPGKIAFQLYDTYGFPLDLVQDILREKQMSVDVKEFEHHMQEQREKAKEAHHFNFSYDKDNVFGKLTSTIKPSEFNGYETFQTESFVCVILKDGILQKTASVGDKDLLIITDKTPFYAESGGQEGDKGLIKTDNGCEIFVKNTIKQNDFIIHRCDVKNGALKEGGKVLLYVDIKRRNSLSANHSATHLLHASLREILGQHVVQKGSLVSQNKFRFDFTHPDALEKEEIERIETLVNEHILKNTEVLIEEMPLKEALKKSAMALFGEKYPNKVRTVKMGENNFSFELCGGTHVLRTGDIGLFKIIQENSIAANIRRIEAVTGIEVLKYFEKENDHAKNIITNEKDKSELLKKEIENLNYQLLKRQFDVKDIISIGNYKAIIKHFENVPSKYIKSLVDQYKGQLKSGVVIITSVTEGKVSLVVGVTNDLTDRVDAVELVKLGVEVLGGKGGGGRKDLAQGGGANPKAISELIRSLEVFLAR
ncbi:MAG: alanine--tRNA ligase [Alphaproteobacteria bacterium]